MTNLPEASEKLVTSQDVSLVSTDSEFVLSKKLVVSCLTEVGFQSLCIS